SAPVRTRWQRSRSGASKGTRASIVRGCAIPAVAGKLASTVNPSTIWANSAPRPWWSPSNPGATRRCPAAATRDDASMLAPCSALMVVTFEPGSHALVSGGGEPRRRFVDRGLFHVEQGFLPVWRRSSRALKQRNALLKSRAGTAQISAWDQELSASGEELTRRRVLYLERLQERLAPVATALAPSLGLMSLEFEPGWRRSSLSLADALAVARERDQMLGHTSVGPHRADWKLRLADKGEGEALSRGQAKLAALSCLFAQAADCAAERADWPLIALDDLASELDAEHRGRVMAFLDGTPAQVFVTGTDRLEASGEMVVFHVEQGCVEPA